MTQLGVRNAVYVSLSSFFFKKKKKEREKEREEDSGGGHFDNINCLEHVWISIRE